MSGIGVVIRDHQGLVISSLSQQLSQAYLVVEVKALAAARTLESASELGIVNAILKGDSEVPMETIS